MPSTESLLDQDVKPVVAPTQGRNEAHGWEAVKGWKCTEDFQEFCEGYVHPLLASGHVVTIACWILGGDTRPDAINAALMSLSLPNVKELLNTAPERATQVERTLREARERLKGTETEPNVLAALISRKPQDRTVVADGLEFIFKHPAHDDSNSWLVEQVERAMRGSNEINYPIELFLLRKDYTTLLASALVQHEKATGPLRSLADRLIRDADRVTWMYREVLARKNPTANLRVDLRGVNLVTALTSEILRTAQ